jgi:hypothetical protein
MAESSENVELPAVDCDILTGFEQIGAWLGITRDQVRYKASAGLIPVWRIAGRNGVFSFKTAITAHMRALASKSRKDITGRLGGRAE